MNPVNMSLNMPVTFFAVLPKVFIALLAAPNAPLKEPWSLPPRAMIASYVVWAMGIQFTDCLTPFE
jgi:hypothetical protein